MTSPPRISRRKVQTSVVDPSRTWYQHPFVVFSIPFIALLCIPHIYNILVTQGSSHPYNEVQLQDIATLLDGIYTTLANMTFIPHTSIKRGPHEINMTAIRCKRDPTVLRLMEILPYVDSSQIQEPDWLFGGHFMDYRRQDHLEEGCDPLRASEYWDYMTPHTLALTNWGTGGWNGDRTWVLMYDTIRHAIKVYEGEKWIAQTTDLELNDDDVSGISIFGAGIEADKSIWARNDYQWAEWFDASILLDRLKVAYQTAAWSPWETSHRETGWGVDSGAIINLLHKNGWPQSFNSDQFNVDFIRARNAPSRRGDAEDAFKRIEELQGTVQSDHSPMDPGQIVHTKARLAQLEDQVAKALDEDEKWLSKWRVQQKKWDLERDEADLEEAKQEVQRLCPGHVCYKDEDIILYEFRALEKEYEKAKHDKNIPTKCQKQVENLPDWVPPDTDRLHNCITQLKLEKYWLYLAYSQSKSEALEHCTKTNATLLPSDTLQHHVKVAIAKLERDIARDEDRMWKMVAWEHNLPAHATKAIEDFRIWESAVANGRWYGRDRIEWFEEQFAEGGDKGRLWRCLDDPECI
ncbi:uncharacterized protein K460DRAFT_352940 [Cucurbitaria berberidis CBS 394.84]|uniref:Uncharacterized protein n=1 Tax=Cucurbitaria berberidis CBS 394.84 TaxID=1168544 RepID=A0A9P4GKA4_9PLEO|nr:uncharacterized protein K460DRAFT_352940 [Cucurbitaria berberidis CBS 394.84]KAF1847873.1 hypothetical protein K460DRAFT_352940 [Cucurbitaria berberidis CBS 394.84]